VIFRTHKLPDLKAVWQDDERRKGLQFILSGVLINVSATLSAGIFFSGYLVYLGASDYLAGLMNNVASWSSILGIFSYLIFERMARRKKLLLTLLLISRILACSVIFLPLIFGVGDTTLIFLAVMSVAGNILWGFFSVGYTIWLMNSFPQEKRSTFIFKRTFWLRIAITLSIIGMGFVLDWTGKSYTGFLIVFITSLVFSLLDAVNLFGTAEPVNTIDPDKQFNFKAFFEPLRNLPFRSFMLFMLLYYTGLTLSSSFTSVYLLRYLGLDYSFVSFVSVLSYISLVVFTRLWRRVEIRIGTIRTFRLTGFIAILEFLFYAFITQNTTYLLLIAPIFNGLGNSGFNIIALNYRYELMPEKNRTVYEGWYGAIFGLGLLIGPNIGSMIMERLPVIENAVIQHSRFQLLYLLSFLLAALILLLSFRGKKTVIS